MNLKNIKFLFLLILSLNSFAKEKITVGLFKLKPFAYKENNEIKGLTYNFIKELLSDDFDIEFRLEPYGRVIQMLKESQVDLTVMYENPKVSSVGTAIDTTFGNGNIVVRRSMKSRFSGLNLIKGKNVGVVSSADYGDEFDRYDFKSTPFLNYEQIALSLKTKRLSYGVFSMASWMYYIQKLDMREDDYQTLLVNFKSNSIYVRNGFDKKLIMLIKKKNQSLIKKYGSRELTKFF